MTCRVSLSSTLGDRLATPARRQSANKTRISPIRTPETSITSDSVLPRPLGSTPEAPIFIDSDDDNDGADGTPTKQKRSAIHAPRTSSTRHSGPKLPDASVCAEHTRLVNTKEEIQDDSINENGTSNAQKHQRATSDCTQLVHAALGKISCEQLSTSEGEGFIYVFRDPKHADVVKIGYSKDVNRRTREHGQCDLSLTIIHISGRVKAMKRAEHLIKADLKHLRRPWKCSVCKRTHGEWFEVDEETAKARVTLWVDWINDRDPYDMDGNIDPLWKYLIEYGRKPRKEFSGKDHEARWEHWNWVLSDPLPKDSKAFQEHQKSFGSGRRRSILSQRRDGEQTAHTPQKHVVHDEGSLVGALSSLGVGQLVPGATQRATIGGTNWTLNINVMCGPHVSWEPNSANKPSQS